jgi:hypothetical protein
MSEICGDSVMTTQETLQFSDGGLIPTSPLQLNFSTIKPKQACYLNSIWHSRFPYIDYTNVCRTGKYVFYCATYNNSYYAVGIWSRPIAANRMKDGWLLMELRRFAISPNAPKNTASRMLSWMKRDIKKRFPEMIRLISYQDTEVHQGTIYKASGWTLVGAPSKEVSWSNTGRKRNAPQSTSPKVRWEINL